MDFSTVSLRWPASGEPMRTGFRLPTLVANVTNTSGPVDFSSGYTVPFTMINLNTNAIKVNASSATGGNGTLTYSWAAADTDTAGDYMSYFTVTDSVSLVQHIPRGKFIVLKIISAT